MFGDDWESDPLIYSLYADVVAGSIHSAELERILGALNVDPELAVLADELAEHLNREDAVRRIFINLARKTPPRRLEPYGPRLVPTFNYLQTAACLFDTGALDLASISELVEVMRDEYGYDSRRLVNSLRDIERRKHLTSAGAAVLSHRLGREEVLPGGVAGALVCARPVAAGSASNGARGRGVGTGPSRVRSTDTGARRRRVAGGCGRIGVISS